MVRRLLLIVALTGGLTVACQKSVQAKRIDDAAERPLAAEPETTPEATSSDAAADDGARGLEDYLLADGDRPEAGELADRLLEKFDNNADGALDRDEIVALLKKIGGILRRVRDAGGPPGGPPRDKAGPPARKKQDFSAILSCLDKDGSGGINEAEFVDGDYGCVFGRKGEKPGDKPGQNVPEKPAEKHREGAAKKFACFDRDKSGEIDAGEWDQGPDFKCLFARKDSETP